MKDKKTFCILPFIHFYTQPDGEVKPCCIAGGFDNIQTLRNQSIEEIFNSDEYKKLRKDMLTGVRNKVCDVCYKKEDVGESSPREFFNSSAIWNMPEVNEDYSVPVDFQHIDIRFSNLCNFKCKMCNHTFSSHWYEDAKKISGGTYLAKEDRKVINASETIVEDIIPYIKNLKSVYFAGGEPLISEQHFILLDWLSKNIKDIDDLNTKKLTIHYNTNLSVLNYRNFDFVKYWNKFIRVHLAISCDGVGKVGEYQRVGFKHDIFVNNLKKLREYANPVPTTNPIDGISYSFQYTATIFNIEHVFDFIDYMISNNFIDTEECISFYYAWSPQQLSLNNIPKKDKIRITKLFNEKIKKLSSEKTKNELISIINYMNSDATLVTSEVNDLVSQLDSLHATDFKNIMNIRL
jgi:hypothetical protein